MVMKKIVLILVLLGGFHQLKAQQKQQFTLDDKLQNNLFQDLKVDTSFKPLLQHPDLNNPSALNLIAPNNDNAVVYSTMPVVKTSGVDHMPIAKLGQPGINYTMLIKKITIVNPADLAQVATP
jgi:hypothetical protein